MLPKMTNTANILELVDTKPDDTAYSLQSITVVLSIVNGLSAESKVGLIARIVLNSKYILITPHSMNVTQ